MHNLSNTLILPSGKLKIELPSPCQSPEPPPGPRTENGQRVCRYCGIFPEHVKNVSVLFLDFTKILFFGSFFKRYFSLACCPRTRLRNEASFLRALWQKVQKPKTAPETYAPHAWSAHFSDLKNASSCMFQKSYHKRRTSR